MLKYIVKRIFIFIPTLIAISLITFVIGINAPGDPVETILSKQQGEGQSVKGQADESVYIAMRHKLGLDLPLFYFSITNSTSPDTLYRIAKTDIRDNLVHLAFIYGSWSNVARYYSAIKQLESNLNTIKQDSSNAEDLSKAKAATSALYTNYEENKV
ncbi:MAG TPA: hypothetical protein VK890_09060, partial [Bacteroidia bacterium]|nr:hypothetical protein [Bacteroidia bacterium]